MHFLMTHCKAMGFYDLNFVKITLNIWAATSRAFQNCRVRLEYGFHFTVCAKNNYPSMFLR